jgi:hypothetical protein
MPELFESKNTVTEELPDQASITYGELHILP